MRRKLPLRELPLFPQSIALLLVLSISCIAESAQVPVASAPSSAANAARPNSPLSSSDTDLEPEPGADADVSPDTASALSSQAAAAAAAADADPSYDLIGDETESLVGRYRGKRVVIVGAGAAGIAAARWLTDRQVLFLQLQYI